MQTLQQAIIDPAKKIKF